MNQLTKLIEQYERENPTKVAIDSQWYQTNGGYNLFRRDFVLWLASRPTCGQEQRKFLDEIIEKFQHDDYICNYIYQQDFTADLSKVIKGE